MLLLASYQTLDELSSEIYKHTELVYFPSKGKNENTVKTQRSTARTHKAKGDCEVTV